MGSSKNKKEEKEEYVLYTSDEKYVVEFLLKQLVLSKSITEALIFDDLNIALRFSEMLQEKCRIECSVNTFIEDE